MEKIKFAFADGEEAAEFFVLEQTRIAGVDYILVTDSEEDEADCWILKDLSGDGFLVPYLDAIQQDLDDRDAGD